ncbi:MAG: hypothetical protein Q7R52_01035 [archaeon]|nr:hypothetical protein [archaeon]
MTDNKSLILRILLKTLDVKPTITFLAKESKLSRVGVWKLLKKLEKNKLILLSPIGAGETSIYIVNLNWESPLLEKTLALILIEEAIKNQKWLVNFAEIEKYTSFFILFGSILTNSKEANDIDIIAVVGKKNNFKHIEETISRIQKTQAKKIHLIDLTEKEFKQELLNKNKAYLDALKKGIILFGQENLIKFIADLNKT